MQGNRGVFKVKLKFVVPLILILASSYGCMFSNLSLLRKNSDREEFSGLELEYDLSETEILSFILERKIGILPESSTERVMAATQGSLYYIGVQEHNSFQVSLIAESLEGEELWTISDARQLLLFQNSIYFGYK